MFELSDPPILVANPGTSMQSIHLGECHSEVLNFLHATHGKTGTLFQAYLGPGQGGCLISAVRLLQRDMSSCLPEGIPLQKAISLLLRRVMGTTPCPHAH